MEVERVVAQAEEVQAVLLELALEAWVVLAGEVAVEAEQGLTLVLLALERVAGLACGLA